MPVRPSSRKKFDVETVNTAIVIIVIVNAIAGILLYLTIHYEMLSPEEKQEHR